MMMFKAMLIELPSASLHRATSIPSKPAGGSSRNSYILRYGAISSGIGPRRGSAPQAHTSATFGEVSACDVYCCQC
jgi:hypothetical protein